MDAINELKHTLRKITGVPDKDLSILDQLCAVKQYKKNSLFLKPGSMAIYSGYVVEGAFREYYTDANGRQFNKAFCFKGDFTGSYYDLNIDKPSLVTIEAMLDSTVVVIEEKKYKKLMHDDIFWMKVSYLIAHNLLMKKFEKELQLLTLSAAERYDLLQKQYPELQQLIPSYHIASFLGITPISLSRIRAQKK